MELFPAAMLRLRAEKPFLVRPLRSDDYGKGFIEVLAQLTQVGSFSEKLFHDRFESMRKANGVNGIYYVVVVEDTTSGKIVGTATLVVEQKFIRQAASAGHIEDVVSDKNVRGKGIGKLLVDSLIDLGKVIGCYKVLLDCSDDNVPFYQRCGMTPKERQMVIYLPPQPKL